MPVAPLGNSIAHINALRDASKRALISNKTHDTNYKLYFLPYEGQNVASFADFSGIVTDVMLVWPDGKKTVVSKDEIANLLEYRGKEIPLDASIIMAGPFLPGNVLLRTKPGVLFDIPLMEKEAESVVEPPSIAKLVDYANTTDYELVRRGLKKGSVTADMVVASINRLRDYANVPVTEKASSVNSQISTSKYYLDAYIRGDVPSVPQFMSEEMLGKWDEIKAHLGEPAAQERVEMANLVAKKYGELYQLQPLPNKTALLVKKDGRWFVIRGGENKLIPLRGQKEFSWIALAISQKSKALKHIGPYYPPGVDNPVEITINRDLFLDESPQQGGNTVVAPELPFNPHTHLLSLASSIDAVEEVDVAKLLNPLTPTQRYDFAEWLMLERIDLMDKIESRLMARSWTDKQVEPRAVEYHDRSVRTEMRKTVEQQFIEDGIVVLHQNNGRLIVIAPSAKVAESFQVTIYDERGPLGDSTFNTISDAVDEAVRGYNATPYPKEEGGKHLAIVAELGAVTVVKVRAHIDGVVPDAVPLNEIVKRLADPLVVLENSCSASFLKQAAFAVDWAFNKNEFPIDNRQYLLSLESEKAKQFLAQLVFIQENGGPLYVQRADKLATEWREKEGIKATTLPLQVLDRFDFYRQHLKTANDTLIGLQDLDAQQNGRGQHEYEGWKRDIEPIVLDALEFYDNFKKNAEDKHVNIDEFIAARNSWTIPALSELGSSWEVECLAKINEQFAFDQREIFDIPPGENDDAVEQVKEEMRKIIFLYEPLQQMLAERGLEESKIYQDIRKLCEEMGEALRTGEGFPGEEKLTILKRNAPLIAERYSRFTKLQDQEELLRTAKEMLSNMEQVRELIALYESRKQEMEQRGLEEIALYRDVCKQLVDMENAIQKGENFPSIQQIEVLKSKAIDVEDYLSRLASPQESEELSGSTSKGIVEPELLRGGIGNKGGVFSLADELNSVTVQKPDLPIEDFGQKIGGARKDLHRYCIRLQAPLPDEFDSIKLSKCFPEPNYTKLLDGGIPIDALAMVKILRDQVPAKPRGTGVVRWVEKLKTLRDLSAEILSENYSFEAITQEIESTRSFFEPLLNRMKLLIDVGFPAEVLGLKGHEIKLIKFQTVDGLHSEEGIWRHVVRHKSSQLGTFEKYEDAVEFLKDRLGAIAKGKGVKGGVKLGLYRFPSRPELGVTICKKIAAYKFIHLKDGFSDWEEAKLYRDSHRKELVALLAEKKKMRNFRRTANHPRIGQDYRGGLNVTAELFDRTFGFRGVEFGNWVSQNKRYADLNDAYDALLDLANILGLPPKSLTLNGELALAFGARGKGGRIPTAAQYEPDFKAINLTKNYGAGALAHEWWHAVDHYFALQDSQGGHLTDITKNKGGIREEVFQAAKNVVAVIGSTGMLERAKKLDNIRAEDMWGVATELTARSFEAYVRDLLKESGAQNDYLVNIYEDIDADDYPYPTPDEAPVINQAFDKFLKVLRTEESEKGIRLFSYGGLDAHRVLDTSIDDVRSALTVRYGRLIEDLETKGLLKIVQSIEGLPPQAQASIPLIDVNGWELGQWELVDFEKRDRPENFVDRHGNTRVRMVSDWENAEYSTGSGQPVVNIYWLRHKATGEVRPFGEDTAGLAIGTSSRFGLASVARDLVTVKSAQMRNDGGLLAFAERMSALNPLDARHVAFLQNRERNLALDDLSVYEKGGRYYSVVADSHQSELLKQNGWVEKPIRHHSPVKKIDTYQGPSGFFDGKTVFLVAEHLTRKTCPGVLLHELGAHAAFPAMFEDHLGSLSEEFNRLWAKGDPYALLAATRVPKNTIPEYIAAERLAYLVELVENHSDLKRHFANQPKLHKFLDKLPKPGLEILRLVRRVVSHVKAWLYRQPVYQAVIKPFLGEYGLKLNAHDITALAHQGLRLWSERLAENTPEQSFAQFSFGGELAAGANLDSLEKAKEMQKSGKDRQVIWEETGWFCDVDKKWRFEIDDSQASLRKERFSDTEESDNSAAEKTFVDGIRYEDLNSPDQEASVTPHMRTKRVSDEIGSILTHTDLFQQYGMDSSWVDMFVDSSQSGISGYFKSSDSVNPLAGAYIRLESPNLEGALKGLLHESQHVIQSVEKFAPGGSVDTVVNELKFLTEHRIAEHAAVAFNYDKASAILAAMSKQENIDMFRHVAGLDQPSRESRFIINSTFFKYWQQSLVDKYGDMPKVSGDADGQSWYRNISNELATRVENSLSAKEKEDIAIVLASDDGWESVRRENFAVKANCLGGALQYYEAKDLLEYINRASPEMLYSNLAGEVEARNVETRLHMSSAERKTTPPWETRDVKEQDIIVMPRDSHGLISVLTEAEVRLSGLKKALYDNASHHPGFKRWLSDYSLDAIKTLSRDQLNDEAIAFLACEHDISIDEDSGALSFYRLTADVKSLIGELPVVVYHYTSNAIEEKIFSEGLRQTGIDVNRHGAKSAGVYVTSVTSGSAVEGYLKTAERVHGGEGTAYSIVTTLKELVPDPDDEDIKSGCFQYVLPYVSAKNIVEAQHQIPSRIVAKDNVVKVQFEGLEFAKLMHQSDVGRVVIWRETGWYHGADDLWRYEISDQGTLLNTFGNSTKILEDNGCDTRAGNEERNLAAPPLMAENLSNESSAGLVSALEKSRSIEMHLNYSAKGQNNKPLCDPISQSPDKQEIRGDRESSDIENPRNYIVKNTIEILIDRDQHLCVNDEKLVLPGIDREQVMYGAPLYEIVNALNHNTTIKQRLNNDDTILFKGLPIAKFNNGLVVDINEVAINSIVAEVDRHQEKSSVSKPYSMGM